MSVVKQRVVLHPNNSPAGGVFSSANFPAISFVIGSQKAFLDPRTLKLSGVLSLKNSAGAKVVNNNQIAASPLNGATLNNSIGVGSLFDEANVSTLNGRNIETIRSYNRYLASSKPLMNSSLDYNNGLGLFDPLQTDKSVINQKAANLETDFSIPIEMGLFEGAGSLINLSEKGFHGLNLEFLLAQNTVAVQPYYLYTNAPSRISATATFSYEIKNLTLSFDSLRMDDKLWNSLPSSGNINYNTISTLNSTLLSSDQTLVMRFGSNAVLSTTHNIIPSLWVNNIEVNSFDNGPPRNNVSATGSSSECPVRTVQYMRGGQLFPYNFMLDSEAQADIPNSGSAAAPQAQIMKPYLNSVSLYDNRRNKFNPNTNIGLLTGSAPTAAGTGTGAGVSESSAMPLASASDPKSVWGLGVPMDSNRQGVSFRNVEYALRIQSELDDTDANSLFTFTRVRNVASYSPTGINVVE